MDYFKVSENETKVYESLGIKMFKDYCPNGGTKIPFGKISFIEGNRMQNLIEYAHATILGESAHIIGSGIFTYESIKEFSNSNYIGSSFLFFSNII